MYTQVLSLFLSVYCIYRLLFFLAQRPFDTSGSTGINNKVNDGSVSQSWFRGSDTLSWFIGILELNVTQLKLLATLVAVPPSLPESQRMTVVVYLKMWQWSFYQHDACNESSQSPCCLWLKFRPNTSTEILMFISASARGKDRALWINGNDQFFQPLQ